MKEYHVHFFQDNLEQELNNLAAKGWELHTFTTLPAFTYPMGIFVRDKKFGPATPNQIYMEPKFPIDRKD